MSWRLGITGGFLTILSLSFWGCGLEFWDCGFGDCDDDYCDGTYSWECTSHDDCGSGSYCYAGECVFSGFCAGSGSCDAGFTCDEQLDTCLPDDGSGCTDGLCSAQCMPGEVRYCDTPTYCAWGEQVCNDQGTGWGECYEASPPPGCTSFGYDETCCVDSGSCCQDYFDYDNDGSRNDSIGDCQEPPRVEPEPSPCPDGNCGCADDSECDDGKLCIESLCTDIETVCIFDFECGAGASCLNNECHATCDDADCPLGQECFDGLCIDGDGADECVFDEDCGAEASCINATCHPTCSDDDDCGPGQACSSGVCQANTAPHRQCDSDAACADDHHCVRGICRLPCAACVNCPAPMSMCGQDGYCIDPAEAAPSCQRAADCGDSESCLNGQCQ